jgi:hypothetical protein
MQERVVVIMKRLLFLSLLSFLLGLSFVPGSFAGGDRSVTILYTGGVRGSVDPCYV